MFYAAVAIYLLATLVQLYPLLRDLRHQLPSDPGDPVLNTWILWWDAHVWPLTARWWNAPAFYPAPGVLSFSEHLFGISLFTAPIQWLSGSPELAYNVAFVLSFPLSAIAMHLLVRDLTGRDEIAFVAGAAYGFSPYRVAQIAHIQVLWAFWLPLALLGLHAGLRGRRWGFPVAAACWLMQGLANGYLLLFFPVLAAFWLLWFTGRRPRTFAVALGWFAVAGLLVLPFLLGYLKFHSTYDLTRPLSEIEFYSPDVSGIFASSYRLKLWGEILKPSPEGQLFPGFIILALAAAGAVWAASTTRLLAIFRPNAVGGRLRWFRLFAGTVALLWGLLALLSWLTGGFSIHLGFAAIPVFNPVKPLEVMIVAAVLYALTGLGATSASRVDRVTIFYLLAAALMFVMCLGPAPTFLGKAFWPPGPLKAPYGWLLMLPGYDGLRVPSRFASLFILCLTVAAALVLARMLPRRRYAPVVAGILGCLVIAEGWFGPVPVVPSPLSQPAPWISDVGGARAVLELPMGDTPRDVAAMLRGSVHGKPVVNGYSGYFPPHERVLATSLRGGDLTGLEALGAYGPIAVILRTDKDRGGMLQAGFAASPDFVRRGTWPDLALYWLTSPPAPEPPLGPALPIAKLNASLWPADVSRMIDGRLDTRWATGGPQRGGEWVLVDLGATRQVGSVVMEVGRSAGDYPRALQVEVSDDGASWTPVFHGSVAGLAVQAALRHPRSMPIAVPVRARARYIRLTQLGQDDQMYWSIAELSVRGPATAP
ncbi:MAG TPA: discoidin domain-containing protein [Vicinamibacterales bacterium]|nr:discoidin domain-containing protein [Vicinamibacterales bacterium]